jgi:hypothetical protein
LVVAIKMKRRRKGVSIAIPPFLVFTKQRNEGGTKLSPPPCTWVLVNSCQKKRQRGPSLSFLAIDKHNKQRNCFWKNYLKFEAHTCIPHLFLAPRNRPRK